MVLAAATSGAATDIRALRGAEVETGNKDGADLAADGKVYESALPGVSTRP